MNHDELDIRWALYFPFGLIVLILFSLFVLTVWPCYLIGRFGKYIYEWRDEW